MYGYPAINVLSISGGSVSVWYSATGQIVNAFPPAQNSQGASTIPSCDKAFTTLLGQNTTFQLITGTSTQSIHICGFTVSFSGATSNGGLTLESGTGSLCATGTVDQWVMDTTSSTPQTIDFARTFSIAPSTNLCLQVASIGASTNVILNLSYAMY
jgi:hypothetical protein